MLRRGSGKPTLAGEDLERFVVLLTELVDGRRAGQPAGTVDWPHGMLARAQSAAEAS